MLDFSVFRLEFRGPANAILPHWLGSTWRGAMGHALKRATCHCSNGTHSVACVYSQLFETPVPDNTTRLRKYPAAPHPYVLRPHARDSTQPDLLTVDALLIGSARAHSRSLVNALKKGAANGLGPKRTRYTLTKLEDISFKVRPEVPAHGTQFKLTFLTPHIVKYRGQIMDCDRFDLTGWCTNLMRRYNSLRYFHGDGIEPTDTQVKIMLDAFRHITIKQQDLLWQRAARHSSRQQKNIDQSGLGGQLTIDLGTSSDLLMPLLLSGTYTHVGKSAVMGHGQYTIEPIG